ncbi:uncharacterized protein LOC144115170 [Amblyomma americanum]
MDLKALKKPESLSLAKELGRQIAESKRKPEILEAIEAIGADNVELEEWRESIAEKEEERKRLEEEEKEELASTDDACSTSDQPAINEMLAELLAGQRKMAEDIADIKRFQQRVNSRFEALESRVFALESSSPTSNGDASDGAVQRQLNSLYEVVSKLASRNDELENRSRRNNLIFHGLDEEDEETNKALFIAVTKVFIDNLQLDCPKIERYHRLGRKQEGGPRPVIVKLLDFREKTQALKNAHRLKHSGISLPEDFSAHVRLIRKKIWDAMQSHRDSGSKVHLRYDHVFIDSVLYNWDDVEKSLVKDSKSTPPDTAAAANATAAKPPADSD